MIPGKAFKVYRKDPAKAKLLANFLNEIIRLLVLNDEVSLGRSFCLNKDATLPGDIDNIDNIRPLVISSVLIKIIEWPLLKELKTVKLNKAQEGFQERLGTEVNIIRLRETDHNLRYKDYKRLREMEKRYLLFVDFKQAFDSVHLGILVAKLLQRGVNTIVINTLIKLMNSSKIAMDLIRIVNVNSGTGQGKCCSTLLFDINIDDLLDELDKHSEANYVFADDIGALCKDLNQLGSATACIDKWSVANHIEVNHRKSGVLVINDDGLLPQLCLVIQQ
jgi:hypothetical protein